MSSSNDDSPKLLVVEFASSNVNTAEGFVSISTNAHPQMAQVRLYEETLQHVIDEHGKQFPVLMPSIVEAVGSAIRDPTTVEPSYRADSVVFEDTKTLNASGHPLRIPVKVMAETNSGLVKTFYFGTGDNKPEGPHEE